MSKKIKSKKMPPERKEKKPEEPKRENLLVIKKRDGAVVLFELNKIKNAIFRAMAGLGIEDEKKAGFYAEEVALQVSAALKPNGIPTVEEVQDLVEKVLIEAGEVRLVRAYISYLEKHTEISREKQQILEKEAIDEVDKSFDVNSLRVLKSRYLDKDDAGKLKESPKDLFRRVAIHAYLPSILHNSRFFQKRKKTPRPEDAFDSGKFGRGLKFGDYSLNNFHLEGLKLVYDRLNKDGSMKYSWPETAKILSGNDFPEYEKGIGGFYDAMRKKEFLPNTPALDNFGRSLGMGSACFVLGVEDSMESIMKTLWSAAFIFKAGGGGGYNFFKLRP